MFCGIDWAEGYHDIALFDEAGQLVAKKRINDAPDGFAALTTMLAAAGDDPANHREQLVARLQDLP